MNRAGGLWLLSILFLLRVLGQVAVVAWSPRFLPPIDRWQSGLLPYPALLVVQVLILIAMVWINLGIAGRRGVFAERRPRVGRTLLVLAIIYGVAMVARYLLTGPLGDEGRLVPRRMIPIVFHLVLASYLALIGLHFRGNLRESA